MDRIGQTREESSRGDSPTLRSRKPGASAAHPTLRSVLSDAAAVLNDLAPDFDDAVRRFRSLSDRLEEGRFHLAVLGQFKRGKSTLLNALLGESILPSAVVPLTSVPTYIRSGETLTVSVHFAEGEPPRRTPAHSAEEVQEILAAHVTETGNPKNALGVSHVEITHPSPLLAEGVVLIDTPGIGSTHRHNTEATLEFLPHCDAALFLVSADPPITEAELAFLEQVSPRVSRMFFVLNKIDYLQPEDRRAAVQFLKKVLTEQAGVPEGPRIFCVSALQALRKRSAPNTAGPTECGLAEIEEHLLEFLRTEKAATLEDAIALKTAEALQESLMRLRLEERSLTMPIEDLEDRLKRLDAAIDRAQRQRTHAGDLLAGDRRRIKELLEERAEELRSESREELGRTVEQAIGASPRLVESELAERLGELVAETFEAHAAQAATMLRERVARTLAPHQEKADELIESVRRAAADLFDVPYHAPESGSAFEPPPMPHWKTRSFSTTLSPIPPGALDRFLPRGVRRRRIRRRLTHQVDELVVANVENLRWSALQSLEKAFIRFGAALDERLAEAIAATQGAIRTAVERRSAEGAAISEEMEKLGSSIERIGPLISELGDRSASREP